MTFYFFNNDSLRGPGVFIKISSKSTFKLFLKERSNTNSYQKLFTKLKNIALSRKYRWSKVSAVV